MSDRQQGRELARGGKFARADIGGTQGGALRDHSDIRPVGGSK